MLLILLVNLAAIVPGFDGSVVAYCAPLAMKDLNVRARVIRICHPVIVQVDLMIG